MTNDAKTEDYVWNKALEAAINIVQSNEEKSYILKQLRKLKK